MTSRPTGSAWTPPRGSSTWSAPRAPPTSPRSPAASAAAATRWPPASPPTATPPGPSTRSSRPSSPSAPPRATRAPPATGAPRLARRAPPATAARPGRHRARRPPEGERTGHGWRARLRQAGRDDLPRRGRQGPAPGAPAARRARRHARPAGHRRAGGRARPCHQAAAVPADGAQALPGRDRLRRRDRHARRQRRHHRHRAGRRHRRGGGRARPRAVPRPAAAGPADGLGGQAGRRAAVPQGAPPLATVAVTCSGGTYVRVLAADLGRELGSLAHLASLRRTAVGAFGELEARTLSQLEALPSVSSALIDPAAAMRSVSVRALSEGEAAALSSGQTLGPTGVGDPVAAVGPDGRLVAVIQDGAGRARARVVLG